MLSAEGYSAPRDRLVGQILQGRYQIIRAIGKGAMGVVYEAQHLLIGRKVALKMMAAHAASPAGVQRFHREAEAAAAVGNSHVVDVLDMGQLEDGSLYIVMEHLNGIDLGFALALEGRFSVGRVIHVVGQLCDALAAIHAAGIVHRDLKPENIFLTVRDGELDFVKVLDFGVCKFNDDTRARLTATGDAVGTPLFMAPEQVEGRKDCDFRVDIYALGAILYFLLAGRAPFDAPSLPALFVRVCHEPAPSLHSADSAVSVELDAIVQRALSKDPNARFSSCSAFKAALRSLLASPDEMAATLPAAVWESRPSEDGWGNSTASLVNSLRLRPARPRWIGIAAAAVGAVAVSASSGAYLRGYTEAPSAPAAQASRPEQHAQPPDLGDAAALPPAVTPVRGGSPAPSVGLSSTATPHEPTIRRHASAAPSATPSALPAPAASGGAPSVAEIANGGAQSNTAPAASGAPSSALSGNVGQVPPNVSSSADVHLSQGPKPEP